MLYVCEPLRPTRACERLCTCARLGGTGRREAVHGGQDALYQVLLLAGRMSAPNGDTPAAYAWLPPPPPPLPGTGPNPSCAPLARGVPCVRLFGDEAAISQSPALQANSAANKGAAACCRPRAMTDLQHRPWLLSQRAAARRRCLRRRGRGRRQAAKSPLWSLARSHPPLAAHIPVRPQAHTRFSA